MKYNTFGYTVNRNSLFFKIVFNSLSVNLTSNGKIIESLL